MLVGSGHYEEFLRAFYGAERYITWRGFVADGQRRIDNLRGAVECILPSRVEGLALSLVEGMACGAACL